MEHYLDYLKALVGHIQHDAATYYANWKQAEANAVAEVEALKARIAELEAKVSGLESRPAVVEEAPR